MNMESKELQQTWIELLKRETWIEFLKGETESATCLEIVKESTVDINCDNKQPQIWVYVSFDNLDKIDNDVDVKEKLLETARKVTRGYLFYEEKDAPNLKYGLKKSEISTITKQKADDYDF